MNDVAKGINHGLTTEHVSLLNHQMRMNLIS